MGNIRCVAGSIGAGGAIHLHKINFCLSLSLSILRHCARPHQGRGGSKEQITDNAATKIILRINDPDSAEYFARSFGTRLIQKTTQRITNTKDIEAAEIVGEGTTREAHQFRASPDMFKTLPTGVEAVLIAHGRDTPHGASSVFRLRFPRQSDRLQVSE